MGPFLSSKTADGKPPTERKTTATMLFDDELQEQLNRLASDGASARKFVVFIQNQELKRDIEGAEAFLRLTQAMIFHFNVGDSVQQFGQYFEDFIEQLALSTEVLAEKVKLE